MVASSVVNSDLATRILLFFAGNAHEMVTVALVMRSVSRVWRAATDEWWLRVVLQDHFVGAGSGPFLDLTPEQAEWLATVIVQHSVVTLLRLKQHPPPLDLGGFNPAERLTSIRFMYKTRLRTLFGTMVRKTVGRSVDGPRFLELKMLLGPSRWVDRNSLWDVGERIVARVSDIVDASPLSDAQLGTMNDRNKVLACARVSMRVP